MRKNRVVYWLCLLLTLVTVVGIVVGFGTEPAAAAEAGIVLEDKVILYPADATDEEMNAAKELQTYLQAITGKKPSLFKEYNGASGIYVGATKFAADNGVTYTNNNGQNEGWAIKVIGKNVVVTGGRERGVLYGVYHLLEDVLGVRWWNMWEEYVPSMTDAIIPADYSDSGEPVFTYRDVFFGETGDSSLFFVRNRMNGYGSNTPADFGGEMGFTGPYHAHTFSYYFPAKDYFAEHPEWFSYNKTTGAWESDGQLCLSNNEMRAAFAQKALGYIESAYAAADAAGRPRPSFISLSTNDTAKYCQCPWCESAISSGGHTGYLLNFVNYVAGEIAKTYPEIMVDVLAFWRYLEVPTNSVVPADNVRVRLANNPVDVMHRLSHSNNPNEYRRVKQWDAITDDMLYWDYGMMQPVFNGLMPNYFRFADDYQYLYENGFMGIFMENGCLNNTEMGDARIWILSKIMEDPYQDIYAIGKEFCTGYYGAAAGDYVYNYMVFMEQDAASYTGITRYGGYTLDCTWMNSNDITKANGYFDSAVAAVEADSSLSAAPIPSKSPSRLGTSSINSRQ